MNQIITTKDIKDFIMSFHGVYTDENNSYYHIPFWFKHIKGDIFELISLEKLPEDLKKTIENLREHK